MPQQHNSTTLTIRIVTTSLLLFLITACETTNSYKKGLQDKFSFYLPGNIAFLPCQNLASFTGEEKEYLQQLPKKLDQEILASFDEQNFIDGYSTSAVIEFLEERKKTQRLLEIKKFFTFSKATEKPIFFYRELIRKQKKWRLLIKDLSETVHFSDALLLPLITKIEEEAINDRGLLISRRSLEVTLLLIEAETGSLIWWEKRHQSLSHQELIRPPEFSYPSYPSWKNFKNKLIVRALWKDFPGWQY